MPATGDQAVLDWQTYSDHRTPGISIKQLLQRGGAGQSLEFNLTQFAGEEFHAPRHRHNFDQIRIGVQGETKYGPNERLGARAIGYFPEGVWYGPTTVSEPTVQAILQFDGPSRLGYVDYRFHDRATAELKETGEFRDGYYYPADGAPRVDGYQAAWEQAMGRPMEYPEPRFGSAVFMHVDAFAWIDSPNGGPRTKHLGTFGERGTRIGMVELHGDDAHAVSSEERRSVLFVLSGSVAVEDTTVGSWQARLLEAGETAAVRATDGTAELIVIDLPDFSAGPDAPTGAPWPE